MGLQGITLGMFLWWGRGNEGWGKEDERGERL